MRLLLALMAAAVLCPGSASAKGEGIGVWMEGRVSEVRAEGPRIRLAVNGRLWLRQYRGTEPSEVEVRDTTIAATLVQAKPFFAMVKDWDGGAIRNQGECPAEVWTPGQYRYGSRGGDPRYRPRPALISRSGG